MKGGRAEVRVHRQQKIGRKPRWLTSPKVPLRASCSASTAPKRHHLGARAAPYTLPTSMVYLDKKRRHQSAWLGHEPEALVPPQPIPVDSLLRGRSAAESADVPVLRGCPVPICGEMHPKVGRPNRVSHWGWAIFRTPLSKGDVDLSNS